MTAPTPPGWYPDPTGIPRQAFWDGQRWHNVSPPPPAAKTTWKSFVAVIGGFLLLAVIYAFFSDTHSTNSGTAPLMISPPAPMNSTVSDGKFSFRVTGVQNQRTAGFSTAHGEYVIVSMIVANTGNEQQTFFANNQKLIDAQGRKYEADALASGSGFIEQLNPGLSINATVAFDVPLNIQPDKIELHDSAFSGGTLVSLSQAAGS